METQNEVQSQGRIVDTLHNQDKVLKESLSLFKGGSLDFLDTDLSGEVTDILSTEITETTTKKAYADNALKLSTNTGIHSEWEAHISKDDIMRFCSANIDLSRMHKIPFTTVVITTKKPGATQYENPSISFKPKIINLKDRDADKVLAEIERKINAGEHDSINALEVIYLPLYGSISKKTTKDLLDIAIKLTPKVVKNDKQKQNKMHDLLILLTGSFVSDEELNTILEANMRVLEDSPAVRVLEDRGRNQRNIEIAQNMLRRGRSVQEISEDTGLDVERVLELEGELQLQA
jgi:hypothetical protein